MIDDMNRKVKKYEKWSQYDMDKLLQDFEKKKQTDAQKVQVTSPDPGKTLQEAPTQSGGHEAESLRKEVQRLKTQLLKEQRLKAKAFQKLDQIRRDEVHV